MFSDSEDEADDHQAAAAEHAKDFNESITQGLRDSAVIHLIVWRISIHNSQSHKTQIYSTPRSNNLAAKVPLHLSTFPMPIWRPS
jgi:hypothetical protein